MIVEVTSKLTGADVDFSEVSKLDIEETSEVLVTIECESSDGCDKPLLFTNSEEALFDMLGCWPMVGFRYLL